MLIKLIKKRHLKKENWFKGLEKKDKNILKDIKDVLDNNGEVFAKKKLFGEIKYISLFEMTDKKEKVLNHVKDVYVDDVSDKTKSRFEKSIEEVLSENVAFGEYKKVEWDGKAMLPQKFSSGGDGILLAPLVFMTFMFIFIMSGEFVWLLIGFGLSSSCGVVMYTKNNKKKKKGKKDD